ncbi:hypothetical protein [Maribellus maritimus]|uniref:hypothetical protein n=1 Tax=Maribellus maritimus TaxID=2870838 RepID=UPI001EEB341B|nr:hypothetical protein [Maribellus maritimus]MCG6191287.1 hypothetical protein [Maribellus maritimus]
MEENNKQLESIWGKWWQPIRKWFYPTWLIYEISYRFYAYSISTSQYIENHQENIASYIGEISTQTLAISSSFITFGICTAFLTVPASFILYQFFKEDNLTGTGFEEKIKRLF